MVSIAKKNRNIVINETEVDYIKISGGIYSNPVGKIAKKKQSERVRSLLIRHSYRLLFRRFCPLGK